MPEKRLKTATLNLRLEPRIKELLQQAATDDHRSITQLLELLVIKHLRAGGYLPDETRPRRTR
jgi:hypothetical protein